MIKLPRPSYPITNYEMTTSGKITLGAMLLELATGFISSYNQNPQTMPQQPKRYRTVQDIMDDIDAIPGLRQKFDALNNCEKQAVIIEMLTNQ